MTAPLRDDISCWSVHTDCDGERFFVRHAYFTGAEEPCDKPESGRIAVKVMNQHGDEVLRVFGV